jgi:hypothetical protein
VGVRVLGGGGMQVIMDLEFKIPGVLSWLCRSMLAPDYHSIAPAHSAPPVTRKPSGQVSNALIKAPRSQEVSGESGCIQVRQLILYGVGNPAARGQPILSTCGNFVKMQQQQQQQHWGILARSDSVSYMGIRGPLKESQ